MAINPRHITTLRNLPISELTDEEIVKAARDRLGSKAAMLVYEDDGRLNFLGHYRKDGRDYLTDLQLAWEDKFGKFKKISAE